MNEKCPRCGKALDFWASRNVATGSHVGLECPYPECDYIITLAALLAKRRYALADIAQKLHLEPNYITREIVLGYLAKLAALEEADPMLGGVASIVLRHAVNAFYDAREAAATEGQTSS